MPKSLFRIYMKIPRIKKYQLSLLVGILIATSAFLLFNLTRLFKIYFSPTSMAHWEYRHKERGNKRLIDGIRVPQGEENPQLTAVNIDNHPDSWPNYGLAQASLVYEAPVEGQLTRFLALYAPASAAEIQKIGPVRSTRPYFVTLAEEYSAMLAHSGGSPAALKKIKSLQTADLIADLEESTWWGPKYYWRVYSRTAPHNLFTSLENLNNALIDWGLENKQPSYAPWIFEDEANSAPAQNENQSLTIKFAADQRYEVNYQYATSSGTYLRFQGGEKHIDALTKEQIAAANVIIQYIEPPRILDSQGRLAIQLTGTGEALVFSGGREIEARWNKKDELERTRFYALDGEEIKFKPGSIWIEIVPEDKTVTIN